MSQTAASTASLTEDGIANIFAKALTYWEGTLTDLMTRLIGPVRMNVTCSSARLLTVSESERLAAGSIHVCHYREGELCTVDGVTIAQTGLILLQPRIPLDAYNQLCTDVPAGALLAPYFPGRADRLAVAAGRPGDPVVSSSAVLTLYRKPVPVGIAWEQFTPAVLGLFSESIVRWIDRTSY